MLNTDNDNWNIYIGKISCLSYMYMFSYTLVSKYSIFPP